MSVTTLATQDELALQFEFLERTELGTFQVKSNNLKDHLEVTRSLFAVAHNTVGMRNHARWVLGDVLAQSEAMHGDDYYQELDSFAELINWTQPQCAAVQRTSRDFWKASMRRLSYDPHTWSLVYGGEDGGENSPLDWEVYDALSRNVGHLDERALELLCYVLWCQGYSHNKAKHLLKFIEMEDEDYTDQIAKIAKMDPVVQADYIAELKAKHKDTEIRGNYLVFTIEKDKEGNPDLRVSRLAAVDDYVQNKSDMIIHKTAREFCLVTGFEDGKAKSAIIPTDSDFE